MVRADYHVHSYFSDDSIEPMENSIIQAINNNFDEICFTEHVDYGVKSDMNCPYFFYFREGNRLKKKYEDKIKVKLGIEFGVQKEYIKQYEDDFAKYDFDFVIMSNHQQDNLESWTYDFQRGKTQEEYTRQYYEAILDCVKLYKNYSVLGHLDLIKRYDSYPHYPDEKLKDILSDILKIVIADGKGIEVNTSSFKYGLDDLTPSRYILELYYNLGGKIITIGSDSHKCDRVGDHFDEVIEVLKEIGFKEIYTFDKMQAIAHRIG